MRQPAQQNLRLHIASPCCPGADEIDLPAFVPMLTLGGFTAAA